MRRMLALPLVLVLALVAAPAADAAITQVFTNAPAPVNCTTQVSGQRFCTATGSVVPSFDGTPIDVAVGLPPAPASGDDGHFPVIGIFHGWGGSKITPSNAAAQRFINQGYAVFSITDRGWGFSCGPNAGTPKPASCAHGYIHLMHNAYEVRDVQTLLGRLADEGVIDGQRIGATGGSYGGGMALQLGALRDRIQLPDGTLAPWKSADGQDLRIAATAPEFGWTDLMSSLMPNGSTLDYVADAPYTGPNGDRRAGIQKQNWNQSLYVAGLFLGFYAPAGSDPSADINGWNAVNSTGGPYDGNASVAQQIGELRNHGAYYTDDSEAPAPALISNGFNDDLFPVDEAIRYYNKIRGDHPDAAISMFHVNFGHNPRAGGIAGADQAKLAAAEDAWLAHYVKGQGDAPADSRGGVDVITSACPAGAAGAQYHAANWASLAPGEVRLNAGAPQVITAPGSAPSSAFTSGTVCTTTSSADTPSAAVYKLDPAPDGGLTLAGSPTVVADLTVTGANDLVASRLYDVDPAASTERLIARGLYRPVGVGAGPTRQVFQLHPQAYKIAAGHVVKLELLPQDSTYARTPGAAAPQQTIQVASLELRLPTTDAPGAAGGLVSAPAAKVLPPGYVLARDVASTVPGVPAVSSGDVPSATGVFTLAWSPSDPASALRYTLQHRDADDAEWSDVATDLGAARRQVNEAEGTWRYRVAAHQDDNGWTTPFSDVSATITVDKSAPAAPTGAADRAPEDATGGWYRDGVTVSFTDHGDPGLQDGSAGSGVDPASVPAPSTVSSGGTSTVTGAVRDRAGNASPEGSLTVKVDTTAPNVGVTCPAAVPLHALSLARITASDDQSGLATDPTRLVLLNTLHVGSRTTSATATDAVGHSTTSSCTTAVRYRYTQRDPGEGGSYRQGSSVAVRFDLADAWGLGIAGADAHVLVANVTDGLDGAYADAGAVRDRGEGRYEASVATRALAKGTYAIKVVLDDGTEHRTAITLR